MIKAQTVRKIVFLVNVSFALFILFSPRKMATTVLVPTEKRMENAKKMSMANETIGTVLFTQEQISKRAKELVKEIEKDFAGEELIVIGTLKGAVLWMSDILKNLTLDTQIDFMIASSYGSSTKSSGFVTIKMDCDKSI